MIRVLAAFAFCTLLVACGPTPDDAAPQSGQAGPGYRAADCNGAADTDVTAAAGATLFTRVVDSDAGCFWQENTAIGAYGLGTGISTWWYRGSDLDTERELERSVGRNLTEVTIGDNEGFMASDDNACSVYVAKGDDVVAWSIQTLNPEMLPDLCGITGQLAKLSQDRMN